MIAEDAHQPMDFPEAQQLVTLEELEVLPEHFLRHAIGAAEVATVGHRNTQVTQGPSACIG
jgi:hypothetical protein